MGFNKRLGRISMPVNELLSVELGPEAQVLADFKSDLETLPPMVGLRQVDLVRSLLTAIIGRSDLLGDSNSFAMKPANNSMSCESPVAGIEGDLAHGNWFEEQGFADSLPMIHFDHELDSYRISAASGIRFPFNKKGKSR